MYQNDSQANRSAGVGPVARPLMSRPLVRFATNNELEAAAAVNDAPEVELEPEQHSVLAGHIRRAWQRNKLFKEKVALDLLRCLRARRGIFSQDELNQMAQSGGLNFVWVDLTETKCRAASAWIREVVFPPGDVPFEFEPSAMPDLPLEYKQAIVAQAAQRAQQAMLAMSQSGQGVLSQDEFRAMAVEIGEQMRDEVQETYMRTARRKAQRMKEIVKDSMAEGGWDEAMDAFVEDFVTYPAAILEGPVYGHTNQLTWLPGWKAGVRQKTIQRWTCRSPFDVFPAPYAKDCQKGDFIVRLRFQRSELFDCIGLEGFNEEAIREALDRYSEGHLEAWLWTEAERQRLEQYTYYTWLSPAGVIDALWYWGGVPGWKLMDWRVKGWESLDPDKDYEVDAILIGPYVVRCEINKDPLKRRPFYNASFDKIPNAFWGRSVPDLAAGCQKMVNGAASALADNMGHASGPMVWVHIDRFADGESSTDVYPFRVWQLKSDPTQGANPGVGFFQANDNSEKLMALIERWETKADDATGIPRYTYGNERVGGAASTLGGLSLLMNNAAKGLRRAIGNIDIHVIAPSVTRSYVYHMLYHDDVAAKGDCFVKASGAISLLIKETQTQARIQMLQTTNNPIDLQILGVDGRTELMRQTFKALEIPIDGIVPTSEQLKQRQAAEQEAAAQAQQQQAEMLAQQQAAEQEAAERALALKREEMDRKDALEREKLAAESKRTALQVAGTLRAARLRKPGGVKFQYDGAGNIAAATES
jgi:hypothetical protein